MFDNDRKEALETIENANTFFEFLRHQLYVTAHNANDSLKINKTQPISTNIFRRVYRLLGFRYSESHENHCHDFVLKEPNCSIYEDIEELSFCALEKYPFQ